MAPEDEIPAPSELARQQRRSFFLIAGTFIVLLLTSIAASWAAIEVVNSTRAYSTGEGRYSKAEKIAVLSLHRYAYSHRNSDYNTFLTAITVPAAIARRALRWRRQWSTRPRHGTDSCAERTIRTTSMA